MSPPEENVSPGNLDNENTDIHENGILKIDIQAAWFSENDWEAEFSDQGDASDRWRTFGYVHSRSRMIEGSDPLLGAVLRLLGAVISMQLMVDTSTPFMASLQFADKRSAAPQDLDERDFHALRIMAEQARSAWLRARLADVAFCVGTARGIPCWQLGKIAGLAYLEHASCDEAGEHPVERRESLQRAMELGWRYIRRDESFHSKLWEVAMELLHEGLENSWLGISAPIAKEIARRNAQLAVRAAEMFEQQAEKLSNEQPNPLVVDTFREAAILWTAARNHQRAQAAHFRTAEALIALARAPGQAMIRADWMLEGIAVLRRNRGDRQLIRELQTELEQIRLQISGEMHSISQPFDVSEAVSHIEKQVDAEDLHDALIQISFCITEWADPESVRRRVIEMSQQHPLSSMFRQVTYNDAGIPVSLTGPFDPTDEIELEKRMIQDVAQFNHLILGRVAIPRAIDLLQERFEPTMADFMVILNESPVTPRGHEWTIARGLLAGVNHDWREAAVFLIPQVEPFIRAAFKRHGINTISNNSGADGSQEEKSLNELLTHPEASSVLSPRIALELKTLLTHKSGHNLRNLYGHGLIQDENLENIGTVVLWWSMLRLILWPFQYRAVELLNQRDAAERVSSEAPAQTNH